MVRPRILISSAIFHGLNDGATVAVPMVFPLLLSQSFILKNYSQIGIMSYLGLLTTFIFQIVIVQVAHLARYQHFLLASCLGISATLFLLSQAKSWFFFLLIYFGFRLFDSFYHTLGLSLVSKIYKAGELDLAMGIQSSSGNFGVFIAFLISGIMAEQLSWQAPLYFWSGFCFCFGLISYFLVKSLELPEERTEALTWQSWKKTFMSILPYLPGLVFAGGGWGLVVYYAPSLFHHRFHLDMEKTGLILALWIGLGTLITYLYGRLCCLFGRKKLTYVGLSGSLITLLLIGLTSSCWFAQLSLYLFGLFLFLIFPSLQASIGAKVDLKNQAQAFSLASNLQLIAGAFFSLVSGFISDLFSIQAPFLMMASFAFLALILMSNSFQVNKI
ncbi:MAG: MFS transporter [Candidatus Aminicenantes bacterium]|nr:MFS transporter [Candidatus Aminicenantes bacterium]